MDEGDRVNLRVQMKADLPRPVAAGRHSIGCFLVEFFSSDST